MTKIPFTKSLNLKTKPSVEKIAFGSTFTDHMFMMEYKDNSWLNPRVVPFDDFQISPAASVLHYGQAIFEGMKAYKNEKGQAYIYRTKDHLNRLNDSAKRLCMPEVPVDLADEAIKYFVSVEKDWIPNPSTGGSLYLRPFMIATDNLLGVRPSNSYLFFVIASPVGNYYPTGSLTPITLLIEREYARSAFGGVGTAKTSGNYAASLKAQVHAVKSGCSQVLWLDSSEKKYVEEVGSMNVFFVKKNGDVITPCLSQGTILSGITRKSVIQVLKDHGRKVEEKRIRIDELLAGIANGEITEAFGTGTAVVISPIGNFLDGENKVQVGNGKTGELTNWLYGKIRSIQKDEDSCNKYKEWLDFVGE